MISQNIFTYPSIPNDSKYILTSSTQDINDFIYNESIDQTTSDYDLQISNTCASHCYANEEDDPNPKNYKFYFFVKLPVSDSMSNASHINYGQIISNT